MPTPPHARRVAAVLTPVWLDSPAPWRRRKLRMHRRELILAGLYWPLLATVGGRAGPRAATSLPPHATAGAFDPDTVPALARALGSAPYRAPEANLAPALATLGYDQYRDLRFDPARSLWRDAGL